MASGSHREPARGALAGVRADLKRAKESGGKYDPNGVGSAWSHNFLNQKPWHPLNFRNQQRVWEAEQQKMAEDKSKTEALAEFQAEQEYLKTLAYMNKDEAEKQRQRQAVSFMYMKPPGYDAALKKDKEKTAKEGGEGGASASGAAAEHTETQQQKVPKQQARVRHPGDPGSHVANVLQAIAARQEQSSYELKHVSAAGCRSPIRGGGDPTAANQQFVVEDEDQEGAHNRVVADKSTRRMMKAHKKELKKRQVEEAQQFLVAAGLMKPDSDSEPVDAKHRKRKTKHSKHKERKKKRKNKKHSDSDEESSKGS